MLTSRQMTKTHFPQEPDKRTHRYQTTPKMKKKYLFVKYYLTKHFEKIKDVSNFFTGKS